MTVHLIPSVAEEAVAIADRLVLFARHMPDSSGIPPFSIPAAEYAQGYPDAHPTISIDSTLAGPLYKNGPSGRPVLTDPVLPRPSAGTDNTRSRDAAEKGGLLLEWKERLMPRPLDIDEHVFDDNLITDYITGQATLEKEAVGAHDVYKTHVSKIEEHRKAFQAKKLNTEAIDQARKLLNSKAPKARNAWLRTFDIARRLLNLDEQADMFAGHIDKGEDEAIAEAAA